MELYTVTLTGDTPLILHNDDIDWADAMETWKNDPANKNKSKAGDDRTPAFRWIGCLYKNAEYVCMNTANIMRSIMEGGAMVPVPRGKSGKTFKSQTQSGIFPEFSQWPITVAGKPIPIGPINALKAETNFSAHQEKVADMGFSLFLKRAKIGQSKHIRVRPIFETWQVSGILTVGDDQITPAALEEILSYAGRYKGLGDWRPGGKTPGPYGTYTPSLKRH